jgi:hypothetical protein
MDEQTKRTLILMTLPVGMITTGVSYLWLAATKRHDDGRRRWLPTWPTWEELSHDMPPITWKTFNHWMVNAVVECFRKDSQYWAKFALFLAILGWVL